MNTFFIVMCGIIIQYILYCLSMTSTPDGSKVNQSQQLPIMLSTLIKQKQP